MKKQLLLIVSIILLAWVSFAKVHTVIVSEYSFTPANFTAQPGDTIRWEWLNGIHPTKSSSIPPNAASWFSNISSATRTFSYVATVPGDYAYIGHPNTGTSMAGNFSVAEPTVVTNVYQSNVFTMFPNPASGPLRLWFRDIDPALPLSVVLADINGKILIKKSYTGVREVELNVTDIPNGLYFVNARQAGHAYQQQLMVAH